jgi:endonuclease I
VLLAVASLAGCPASSSSSTDLLAAEAAAADSSAERDRAHPLPALDLPRPPDQPWRWPDLADDRPLKGIEHLGDGELKSALYDLVKNHKSLGYDTAKKAIFTVAGGGVDIVGGVIECIYTGLTTPPDGTAGPGTLNAEHTWPQSEGADKEPARSDLNHIFPSDNSANSYRGSLPYGETDCAATSSCSFSVGGSVIGPVVGGSAKVFSVRPERRGEIARAHFYFSVRYGLAIPDSEEKWLRGWNQADLPDPRERDRAAAIEALQLKRNPFVDRPDFVDKIADF